MKFTSFYTGFFVKDLDATTEKFEKLGFTVKHRTSGDGFFMNVMELPKGDRVGIIKAPPEMGDEQIITLANVDNIEEAEDLFVNQLHCTKVGEVMEKPSTKFLNVLANGHLITIMEHIK